jgi:cyclopropane-fatty-acyl-phospholipid synthase
MWYEGLLYRDIFPDRVIRMAIRRLNRIRLAEEDKGDPALQAEHLTNFIEQLKASPIAINTRDANEQHYEVPAPFFEKVLGKHLKYSACYWPDGVNTLDASEEEMLRLYCERAELRDGLDILELGCGWGSLSLYMAAAYPGSRIVAVSNSSSQKAFIEGRARDKGITNLSVITEDMNRFEADATFDRVVSIEMFEHMRNYRELLSRIARWLKPGGKLFVHIFSSVRFAYPFEVRDSSDWMAKNFFTGGIMPSDDLLLYFQEDLKIQNHWRLSGTHYQKTAEAWIENMDRNRESILSIFQDVYGQKDTMKMWVQWRVFFMACAELFGYQDGGEWIVSHYLFQKYP